MQTVLQKTKVTYLFDPLCGWCYGASPMIQKLGQQTGIDLELAPTGLFSGAGARAMNADFAQYAWSNDQRIQKLTGQVFSENYRTQLLDKPGSRFDSGPGTLALTAVFLTEPQREAEVLKVLQEARYIHALDSGQLPLVEKLLRDLGLTAATELLSAGGAELLAANAARMRKAQGLMQSFGAQGVPTLVITDENGSRLLRGDALYGRFETLLSHIAAA
ncbi:MAG: DsbA family protein [Pseudomonadota bacterium]